MDHLNFCFHSLKTVCWWPPDGWGRVHDYWRQVWGLKQQNELILQTYQIVRVLGAHDLHAVDWMRVSRWRERGPLHWGLLLSDTIIPKDDLPRVGSTENKIRVKASKCCWHDLQENIVSNFRGLSWHSGCFQNQRSKVQIQWSAKFCTYVQLTVERRK